MRQPRIRHPLLGSVVDGFGLFIRGVFWLPAAITTYYLIIRSVQVHKAKMVRTCRIVYGGLAVIAR
jgi:hypothetical protein